MTRGASTEYVRVCTARQLSPLTRAHPVPALRGAERAGLGRVKRVRLLQQLDVFKANRQRDSPV